jgi:hypothetical protein
MARQDNVDTPPIKPALSLMGGFCLIFANRPFAVLTWKVIRPATVHI